jgi:hypothetical protein
MRADWEMGEVMKALTHVLRTTLLPCLSALALAALTAGAQAQLSSAQQSALKSSCRSDFMSHCSGVTPGGRDALACLQKNVARLSPACQGAVRATLPPPAAAKRAPTARSAAAAPAARPTAAQQKALKASCRSDFMSHCSGVKPGGQEALACLQGNAQRLSPACRKAVAALGPAAAPMPLAAPAAVAPPPSAVGNQPAFVPGAGLIAKACARDLILHCRGIAGHGKAVACLKARAASGHRLGLRCKAALKVTSKLR